jgi:hypothetical protein
VLIGRERRHERHRRPVRDDAGAVGVVHERLVAGLDVLEGRVALEAVGPEGVPRNDRVIVPGQRHMDDVQVEPPVRGVLVAEPEWV